MQRYIPILAALLALWACSPSSAGPSQDRMEWVVFQIPESGEVVRALYLHPEPGKKLPAVIYHHGAIIESVDYEGGKEQGYDVADFVKALAAHQYVAIAPMRPANTGEDFAPINHAIMNYLQSKSDVDMDHVAVIGFSKGGAAALQATALMPQMKAAVLMSPTAENAPTESQLEAIKVPMLVTSGQAEKDLGPPGKQRSVVPALQQHIKGAEFKSHYAGDQAWFQKVREEYWGDILQFLDAYLRKPPAPAEAPQPRDDAQIAKDINRSIAPRTSGVGGSAMILGEGGVGKLESIANFFAPGMAVDTLKNVVGRWEVTVERNFNNYEFKLWNEAPTHLQVLWESEFRRVDENACARVYGEAFFRLFLEYHRVKMLAALKFLRNDYDGAKDSLQKARDLTQQLRDFKPHKSMPRDLWDQMAIQATLYTGVVEVAQGNQDKGRKILQSGFDQAKAIAWKRGMAYAAYYIAMAAERAKDPEDQKYFQQSLEVARAGNVLDLVWQCYFNLGFRAFTRGNFDEAIVHLEESVKTIEAMRKTISGHQRDHFMGGCQHIFFTLLDALWNKGDGVKAFEVSDNAKSRALTDLLKFKQGKYVANVKPALLKEEEELLEHIADLEVQADDVADQQLGPLKVQYAGVLEKIKAINPEFSSLRNAEYSHLQDVQAMLDDQTVLIEYYLSPGFLLEWLVTNKSLRMERVDIPGPDIADKVQTVHMLVRKPKLPAVYKLLGQLHEILISRFDADIEGKNIVFVPDATLSYLPFAALMDKNGKFLMEKNAISSIPSSNILRFCIEKRRPERKTLLVLGNPDLGDPKMDLPFAQQEAENIAKQFPGAKLCLRGQATESGAKKMLGDFDILHFACHGEMNAQEPMQSCLRLAPDKENDGKLEAGEIFELALRAQLVVLSGCETGLGTFIMGNEILGMTRAFFYAGAPSVIASFWKVDDNATSILMSALYENLAKDSKAEALRKAQLAAMQAKKHPYYWASFYLTGDGK